MIERISISLPYSSTVVVTLVFVGIKTLQLPDSCKCRVTRQALPSKEHSTVLASFTL